jgi:hypothetical protein
MRAANLRPKLSGLTKFEEVKTMRREWDTFILTKLDEVVEHKEELRTIRDVSPQAGTHKYKCKLVRGLISKDPDKYPDLLRIRLGRGQLSRHIWSIKVTEEVEGIPTKPYHMSGGIAIEED